MRKWTETAHSATAMLFRSHKTLVQFCFPRGAVRPTRARNAVEMVQRMNVGASRLLGDGKTHRTGFSRDKPIRIHSLVEYPRNSVFSCQGCVAPDPPCSCSFWYYPKREGVHFSRPSINRGETCRAEEWQERW